MRNLGTWMIGIVLVAGLGAAAGCSRSGAASRGGGSAGAAVAAWKAAGLSPSEFAPVDGAAYGAGQCRAGTVDGVETTLCEFPDEAAAKAAEKHGLAAVGEATGAALASGRLLLVVADRKHADPNGRRINQIAKTFRQLR